MTDATFDLDAFVAEAEQEPFRFRFGGQDFTLPAGMDLRIAAKMRSGQFLEALQMLLGEEQFARFDALPAVFDTRAATALLDRYAQHLGVSLGESQGSST